MPGSKVKMDNDDDLPLATSDSEKALTTDHLINPFSESGYQSIKHLLNQKNPTHSFKGSLLDYVTVINPHQLNSTPKYQFEQKIAQSFEADMVEGRKEQDFLNALASHRDILFLDERPDASHDGQLRLLAAHVLNRCLITRDLVNKNDAKLAKDADLVETVRDQGFTRPRFLVLMPFKNTAFKFIGYMMSLWKCNEGDKGQIEQRKRFVDEYGKMMDEDGEEVVDEDLSGQPADYQHVFSGNIDDCFRMGIKMTRKSLKLFADFYSADIIIASPLGLKLAMTGQDRRSKGEDDHKKKSTASPDHDFLSSIESIIVDQADVIAMQNWEHLMEIVGKLNCLPKEAHNCDFSRVMSVFLDGQAKAVRQSVFLSAFAFPELLSLFSGHCSNLFGAVKFELKWHEPCFQVSTIKPEFHCLPKQVDVELEAAARFQYFCENSLKSIQSLSHVVVFVSNYFEFLKVKEHLENVDVSFAAISEYSQQKDVTRARSRLHNGHVRILLLTERFHFYHRFTIKGVKRVVFYSLPVYPVHFAEFVGMVSLRSDSVKVAPYIICSLLDGKKLERIFGSKNVQKIQFI